MGMTHPLFGAFMNPFPMYQETHGPSWEGHGKGFTSKHDAAKEFKERKAARKAERQARKKARAK
jgi:hypothetical protein